MRVDPVPFIAWFDAQTAAVGVQGALSRIGWEDESADRRIRRWRGEAQDVDALDIVDALHMAGAAFEDVYDAPEHADARAWVAAEPDRELGREWTARRKLGKPIGVHGRMTETQVRAAHVLYAQQGLSFRALGVLLWERFGYPTPKACESSLLRGFTVLGLPRRSQAEATAMANLKHGRCVGNASHGAAYQRWWRAQRAARNPCAQAGCPHPARPGENFCGLHRPGFDEERAAYAAAGRAAQAARPPVVTPDLLRTAIALHHELRWDVSRIARDLIGATRVTGVDYLAKLLREELRARGAYLGPRPERVDIREAVAA